MRYRVWWALYTLEQRLCNMTGRASSVPDQFCTAPLPVPLEEDQFDTETGEALFSKEAQERERAPWANPPGSQPHLPTNPSFRKNRRHRANAVKLAHLLRHTSDRNLRWAQQDLPPNTALFFLHLVQLSRLSQTIFNQLYGKFPGLESRTYDPRFIHSLLGDLDAWRRKLPAAFDFTKQEEYPAQYVSHLKFTLGLLYYEAKMRTLFPYVSRRCGRSTDLEFSTLQDSADLVSRRCVEAALALLDLFPDGPAADRPLRIAPWWGVVPCLVQAAAVLSMEIYSRTTATAELMEAATKAINWLHVLGRRDPWAKRAWIICNLTLRIAIQKS